MGFLYAVGTAAILIMIIVLCYYGRIHGQQDTMHRRLPGSDQNLEEEEKGPESSAATEPTSTTAIATGNPAESTTLTEMAAGFAQGFGQGFGTTTLRSALELPYDVAEWKAAAKGLVKGAIKVHNWH